MGNQQSGPGEGGGPPGDGEKKKAKKYEPPIPSRIGKRKKKRGPDSAHKLPEVTPHTNCKLRLLKLQRIKDYLLMEGEFIQNQELLKPQDDKKIEERKGVEELRGSPMSVGTLEEIIDDNHAIVSSAVGPEYYVTPVVCRQRRAGARLLGAPPPQEFVRGWCARGGHGPDGKRDEARQGPKGDVR